MSSAKFINSYIEKLTKLLEKTDLEAIEKIIESIKKTVKNKSKVYVMGNGGSSATASHMANDLGVGLRRRGLVNIDIVSLGDNSAVTSAIANDLGFENIFYISCRIKFRR